MEGRLQQMNDVDSLFDAANEEYEQFPANLYKARALVIFMENKIRDLNKIITELKQGLESQ